MARVKLKDIAKHANVSISTVSRVLSGQSEKYRIKKETENAVFAVANELGFNPYRPVYQSEMLASKKIALFIPDISHHFLSELAKTVVREAWKNGYTVAVYDTMEDTEAEMRILDSVLRENRVDGFVIIPVGVQFNHLHKLYAQGIPMVVLDRISGDLKCPYVAVENFQGTQNAVDYLIDRGHKDIACVQRLPDSWINNERLRGFRAAFEAHGLPVSPAFVIGESFGQQSGYVEVKLLLKQQRPTAIVALSHIVALGALRAIHEEGLRVPDDISLISFDDIPYTAYFVERITCIKQPIDEMGLMAFNFLFEQINNKSSDKPSQIQLPVQLLRHHSVKRLSL